MSFFPDITPLTNEVKKFTEQQKEVIALLQEQNQLLKEIIKNDK
jgi:hypothetical protein